MTWEELEAAGGSYSYFNKHGVQGKDWWRFIQALLSTDDGKYSDLIRIVLADGTCVDYEFELPEGYMQCSDLDDPEAPSAADASDGPEKQRDPEHPTDPTE